MNNVVRPYGPCALRTPKLGGNSNHLNRGARRSLLGALLWLLLAAGPAWGVLRDGGVDPANLGKGGWILYPPADPDATFSQMQTQGFNYVIVKAGRADMLWTGSWSLWVPPSAPEGAIFTSELVESAHSHGLLIFGSNRSGGDSSPWTIDTNEITGEIAVADYVFEQGADGFIWDAEAQWEKYNAGLDTNGPALAWLLASTVRAHWPTKFLALNVADTLYLHGSLPFKEFAYWSDCIMPMVYHHSATEGNAFAAIHWMDVNYRAWQDSLVNSNSVIGGETFYWSNSIKPLVLMRDVYGGTHPDEDVRNFMDYLLADPNCVTAGGYQGFDGYRSELFSEGQIACMQAATVGAFPGIINNIVLDDAQASVVGDWTLVKTIDATTGSTVTFSGATGSDTNSFGTNYFCKGQGDGSACMQFTPNIIAPGDYKVYAWHPYRDNASAGVPHIITCNGGSTTVYADQTIAPGTWSLLGTFNFAAGTAGSIKITDAIPEPGGLAMVDGLKLVFMAPNPPKIEHIELLPGEQIRLQLSGCPGHYSIDAATTLGSWGELTNFITSSNRFECVLPQTTAPRQFYRARLLW